MTFDLVRHNGIVTIIKHSGAYWWFLDEDVPEFAEIDENTLIDVDVWKELFSKAYRVISQSMINSTLENMITEMYVEHVS